MNNMIIKNASEIVTCSGNTARFGKEMNDIKVIKNASIVIEDGIIKDFGEAEKISQKYYDENKYEVIDATGKAVLPGFVDSHTHFIFGGYRAEEFSWRLRGDSYMDIMNRGGGIVSTVKDTRDSSKKELYKLGKERDRKSTRLNSSHAN